MEMDPDALKIFLQTGAGICTLKACLSTETTAQYFPRLLRKQQALARQLQEFATRDPDVQCLFSPRTRKLGHRLAERVNRLLSDHYLAEGETTAKTESAPCAARLVALWLAGEPIVLQQLPPTESEPTAFTLPPSALRAIDDLPQSGGSTPRASDAETFTASTGPPSCNTSPTPAETTQQTLDLSCSVPNPYVTHEATALCAQPVCWPAVVPTQGMTFGNVLPCALYWVWWAPPLQCP